jgi:hypothetical protein
MRVYATLSVLFVAFLFESAALTAGGITAAGKYVLSAVIVGIGLLILGFIWRND